jgi:hypothetical protein
VLRILRAFAWMRWRVLMNSLERTGARDTLERFSLAIEQIGPIIAFLLLVPSVVGLAGLGGYAGYWLASGEQVMTFEMLVLLLFAACGFAVIGPILLPSIEPTTMVRLLLLPIPRQTLYLAHAASSLTEPWVLMALPVVVSVPLGLAAGGAPSAAAIAFVAGLLFLVCLIGLSTLSTVLLHLLVRDRRRGELVMLAFIVLVPALAMLPGLLLNESGRDGRRTMPLPAWVTSTAKAAYAVVPSQPFGRATREAARADAPAAVRPLASLTALAAVLHGLGVVVFGRLLDSPSATSRRRVSSAGELTTWHVPFLSRGSAAIAQTHVRLAMRTPRGRSSLLSPFVVFLVFAVVVMRRGEMELGFMNLTNGLGLAAFGTSVCLLAILPFAMNQFAVDRAGLTLTLLAPVHTREILAGKALGNGLLAAMPALVVYVLSFSVFPGGPLSLWLSLPIALAATYLMAAPGAAALSAIFPRAVDLNSIGQGSNPHAAANLLGFLMMLACGAPAVLIAVVLSGLLRQPALTPIAMLLWCGIAFVLSRLLFRGVEVLLDKRRENLGLVV